jgi:hypothetical protein
MKMIKLCYFLIVLVLGVVSESHFCLADTAPLDGRDLMMKIEGRRGYTKNEFTGLEMTLVNSKGKKRIRKFVRYQFKLADGTKKTLMKFLAPNDIRDTGTLNQEVVGENDIQHLYLPALRRIRRIGGQSKSQSWVGSDFSFEDIQETEVDDFTYTLLEEEEIEGHPCYKFQMIPKTDDASSYGKQIRWARKAGYLPVKWEYYDKSGELLKVLYARDLKPVSGIQYAWTLEFHNVQDKHKTLLKRLWLKLDEEIPESIATTRQLKKSINLYTEPSSLKELIEH